MGELEEQRIARLELEYTPLDPALVRAIALDYDILKPNELKTLCEFLDTLRASAAAEETSSFDPSGTSVHGIDTSPGIERRADRGNNGSGASTSADTESTSISAGFSALSIDSESDSQDSRTLNQFSNLDNDEKISVLADLFPTLKTADIVYTLKKSGGDIGRTMDFLLNQVFFEDNSTNLDGGRIFTRGVEAFSEDNVIRRPRKKKTKGKKFQSFEDYSPSSSETSLPPTNKWETANSDIEFISSRVNVPYKSVSSIYHKHGATRRKAISALVEDHLDKEGVPGDTQLDEDVVILTQDFPALSFEQCAALIQLTTPSTANAHELAKALTISNTTLSSPTKLVPQYLPTNLEDDGWFHNDSPSTTTTAYISGDSSALLVARSTAFGKASQYHRKGKSDRLMGGAAAYYSSLGREYSSSIKIATAAEADALVSSQSSSVTLDLHGVTVKEGTRIACQRVQTWWNNLGESKIRSGGKTGIGQGYQVVTGVGRHSQGGVGKLGPAVMKALLRDGWKIEVGSGVLTVTGRMKR